MFLSRRKNTYLPREIVKKPSLLFAYNLIVERQKGEKRKRIYITNNDNYIVYAQPDGLIKVKDLLENQLLWEYKGYMDETADFLPSNSQTVHYEVVDCIAISTNSKYIVIGLKDGSVTLIDFESKKEVKKFPNVQDGTICQAAQIKF